LHESAFIVKSRKWVSFRQI